MVKRVHVCVSFCFIYTFFFFEYWVFTRVTRSDLPPNLSGKKHTFLLVFYVFAFASCLIYALRLSLSLSFLYAHSLSLQYKWSQTFYTYECLLKKGLWKLTFPVRLFDLPTFSSNTCRLCIWIIFFPLSWLLSLSLSLSFSLCPHSNCTCFD